MHEEAPTEGAWEEWEGDPVDPEKLPPVVRLTWDHTHLTDLSQSLNTIGSAYEVDPIEDLVPVCPNCHSLIHLVNPPMSVEELHRALQKRAASNTNEL